MAQDKPIASSKLGTVFADETKARAYLEFLRWGDAGAACPHCGGDQPYKLTPKAGSKTRKGLYKCRVCRKQFTVTVGTIFEDSHIPITKWLQALYLITSSKKGISSHQLHRMLGVTYKSAWFMTHRLRYAMAQEPLASKLAGVIEIDETYVGGKRRGRRGRPAVDGHKSAVIALVERGGRVKAMPIERVTSDTLKAALKESVMADATIMSDELPAYIRATDEFPHHHRVTHSRREYVRGILQKHLRAEGMDVAGNEQEQVQRCRALHERFGVRENCTGTLVRTKSEESQERERPAVK
jgi:transposase-like protein